MTRKSDIDPLNYFKIALEEALEIADGYELTYIEKSMFLTPRVLERCVDPNLVFFAAYQQNLVSSPLAGGHHYASPYDVERFVAGAKAGLARQEQTWKIGAYVTGSLGASLPLPTFVPEFCDEHGVRYDLGINAQS